ncbi:MAG: acyltransferase [Muribaculaceae bacterium]|nr:acyltransferase [Muribaculaceae bacterium]
MEQNKSIRLHYFDMLKGVAIFMVVIGHVLTMCIREIDNAVLFKFVEKIHMPVFFFISGYFTYKVIKDGKLAIPDVKARAKQLLIPFFAVSTLWIYYFPHSGLQSPFDSTWEGLYFSTGKNGYWFTLCLFEIILLYCALISVLERCKSVAAKFAVVVAVWIVLGLLTKFVFTEKINSLIGVPLLFEFFPVFMFGIMARSVKETFDNVTSDSKWITIAIVAGSFLMYYVCWSWEFSLPVECVDIARQLLYVCVVIVSISVAKSWSFRAFGTENPRGSISGRVCEYIGRQSLAVYLLHYFFLFPLTVLREPLIEMNLGFVPTLIFASFFASIIIAVTLGANYIICHSKPLALLLTGKEK